MSTIQASSAPTSAQSPSQASVAPTESRAASDLTKVKADAAAFSAALNTIPTGQAQDGVKVFTPESLGGSLLSRSI